MEYSEQWRVRTRTIRSGFNEHVASVHIGLYTFHLTNSHLNDGIMKTWKWHTVIARTLLNFLIALFHSIYPDQGLIPEPYWGGGVSTKPQMDSCAAYAGFDPLNVILYDYAAVSLRCGQDSAQVELDVAFQASTITCRVIETGWTVLWLLYCTCIINWRQSKHDCKSIFMSTGLFSLRITIRITRHCGKKKMRQRYLARLYDWIYRTYTPHQACK